MPSKVNFKFEFDENQDQALLGDLYHVLITYEPEPDISLKELTMIIDGVESETQVAIPQPYEMEQSSDLMQSQSLDETGLALTTPSTIVSSSGLQRSMTVLRKQPEAAAPSDAKSLPMFVAGHGIGQSDTEIAYNLTPIAEDFGPESQANQAQDIANLKPLFYKQEDGKSVTIPLTTRRIRLGLRFFSESP